MTVVHSWGIASGLFVSVACAFAAELQFTVHEIARPGGTNFGQTSAADVDRDGDIDFISGEQFGMETLTS